MRDIAVKEIIAVKEMACKLLQATTCGHILDGYTQAVARPSTIGANLLRLLSDRGISRTQFGDELAIRQPSVTKLTRASEHMEVGTALRLAVYLKCSMDDLLAGVNREYDSSQNLHAGVVRDTSDEVEGSLRQINPDSRGGTHGSPATLDRLAKLEEDVLAETLKFYDDFTHRLRQFFESVKSENPTVVRAVATGHAPAATHDHVDRAPGKPRPQQTRNLKPKKRRLA